MPGNIRSLVAEKLLAAITQRGLVESSKAHQEAINWGLRVQQSTKNASPGVTTVTIANKYLKSQNLIGQSKFLNDEVTKSIPTDDTIKECSSSAKEVSIGVCSAWFAQNVLEEIQSHGDNYGTQSILHQYHLTKKEPKHAEKRDEHDLQENTNSSEPTTCLVPTKQAQTIIVEYSSPNIAKRFHAGHVRSTVIGHCLACLCRALVHNVTTINYLGDWGTQFGFLGVGFTKFGSPSKLLASPMQHLFEVYVKANKAAEKDETFKKGAMEFFFQMENGDELALDFWSKCRELSIEEYKETYKRLGVEFDEFEGESMYQTACRELHTQLLNKGLLRTNPETGVQYVEVSKGDGKASRVNLFKSDGTSLYLTRDITAFKDRLGRHGFDRHLYVVDESQGGHFEQLVLCLKKMEILPADCPYRDTSDYHVAFGRVNGMSTRRGEVVLLSDVIDEARDKMVTNMLQTDTTRVSEDQMEVIAEKLAVSALAIQNLSMVRIKAYTFSWERVLHFNGSTGPALQYTHARLTTLLRKCENEMQLSADSAAVDWQLLAAEPEAMKLVILLAGFDEVVMKAFHELAPHHITNYLFDLKTITSKCFKTLHVLNQPREVAQARMLLFSCTRQTLNNGLRMLGIEPINEM